MKILVTGHSLVIDANRGFWNAFARLTHSTVDLIAPAMWSSNLKKDIELKTNKQFDSHLNKLLPTRVFFRGKGSLFFFSPLKLIKTLNSVKYDILYLNQETWSAATLVFIVARFFSINKKTPLFLCVAQNLKKEKFKILHPYERLISLQVTNFLHCSQEVEDVLRWKGIKTPSVYFPLPYDEESYKTSIHNQKLFTLGYLGRISEDKGISLLLRVLDEINKDEVVIPLVTAGKGPLEEELLNRKYVKHLGLIPHNEAFKFYRNIDLFVLPSQTMPHWKEQFGRVITEAFASGVPVLGSSSGSIPEVLGKLEWPWVFKEDSSTELKDKILELRHYLSTETGRAKLLESVKKNQELFSQKSVAHELNKAFLKTLQP